MSSSQYFQMTDAKLAQRKWILRITGLSGFLLVCSSSSTLRGVSISCTSHKFQLPSLGLLSSYNLYVAMHDLVSFAKCGG